jgi:hypothetical protein
MKKSFFWNPLSVFWNLNCGNLIVEIGLIIIPARPRAPRVPGIPRAPGIPGIPSAPGVPRVPGIPGAPRVPGAPGIPGAPRVPGAPGIPRVPRVPAIPRTVDIGRFAGMVRDNKIDHFIILAIINFFLDHFPDLNNFIVHLFGWKVAGVCRSEKESAEEEGNCFPVEFHFN